MKKNDSLLNLSESADFIGITRTTFYNWLKKGYLPKPIMQIGAMPIYDKSDLLPVKKKWQLRKQDMTL